MTIKADQLKQLEECQRRLADDIAKLRVEVEQEQRHALLSTDFTVQLTGYEVRALTEVLRCVGGAPRTTARRHTDKVLEKLLAFDMPYRDAKDVFEHNANVLIFASGS